MTIVRICEIKNCAYFHVWKAQIRRNTMSNAIAGFIKGLCAGKPFKKSAKDAGLFIAENNKAKVAVILPSTKSALCAAVNGKMTQETWDAFFKNVFAEAGDAQLKQILCEVVDVPKLRTGKVCMDAVAILEAFSMGLEAKAN